MKKIVALILVFTFVFGTSCLQAVAETNNSNVNRSKSILNNNTIKKLIDACPTITKVNRNSAELFSDYNEVFPKHESIHTWLIYINTGFIVFGDEFDSIILVVKPKGSASELIPLVEWEIQLLEALPQIIEQANHHGLKTIVKKKVELDSRDYIKYADSNGNIDLNNSFKYQGVLSQMKTNLSLLKLAESFSQLGGLDKN